MFSLLASLGMLGRTGLFLEVTRPFRVARRTQTIQQDSLRHTTQRTLPNPDMTEIDFRIVGVVEKRKRR